MLYLTYCSNLHDGFGAQYQRILGVYSICKEYNYGYIHTKFQDIEYQGLQALELNKNDTNYVKACNERFLLENTHTVPSTFDKIIKKDLNLQDLQALDHSLDILVQYKFPYVISDKITNIYKHVSGIYTPHLPKNQIFTIGLHVRRGELNVVSTDRLLPNSYYIDIAKNISRMLDEENINYVIELYTEVASKVIKVTPTHVGIKKRIHKAKSITPESSAISDFDILPNLQRYINENMFDTFDRMINCDILVASKSSFSACAAYLKTDGFTIYHPFWHTMNTTDISIKDKYLNDKIQISLKNKIEI